MNKPMGKLPYITFYTGDWLKDQVAGCSLAAQGLWLRLMIVAHNADRYGYLAIEGVAIPPERLARMCSTTLEQYTTLLDELDRARVPSWTPKGVMYSRRMVKDARHRLANAKRQSKHRSEMATQASRSSNGCVTHESQGTSENSFSSVLSPPSAGGKNERGNVPSHPAGACANAPPAGKGKSSTELPPTIDEALKEAQSIDLAEWKAKDWWAKMQGVGWRVKGDPVRDWRVLLQHQKRLWQRDGSPKEAPSFAKKTKAKKEPESEFIKSLKKL